MMVQLVGAKHNASHHLTGAQNVHARVPLESPSHPIVHRGDKQLMVPKNFLCRWCPKSTTCVSGRGL